jgi:nucleotide-binding universal stress UspA family protein
MHRLAKPLQHRFLLSPSEREFAETAQGSLLACRPALREALVSQDGRGLDMIKKILVPTDFSSASTKALERAVVLANQCDAALTILHVVDINAPAECGSAAHLMQTLWQEGSTRMGEVAWSLCGQVHARTTVEEGLAWEKIVEQSRESDLVVLGKSQVSQRWKLFSQRTAERVLENAACPVMVVTERGQERSRGSGD